MDKSWTRKWRGSREYIDGVKAFVRFAVSNARNKDLIVCPCKKCRFRKTLREQEVFDHLTAGSGILPGYTDWIWHGEKISAPLNSEPIIEDSSSMPANKAPIPDEETTMGAMLHDVFGMHDVRTDEGLFEMGLEVGVVEEDKEADDDECAKKFFNLLKDAEKPLHENTRQKGVASSRSELFEATHTKKDGTPVNQETGEKIEEIQEFMTQEPTTSGVSTQGSISWYPDDPYTRAMKKPEYSGRVRGTGLGPIHASSSRSLYRSTSEQAYQSPDVVAQNEKIAAQSKKLAAQSKKIAAQSKKITAQSEQIAAQSEQLAAQSAKIAAQEAHMIKMQKILETIMANSEMGNAFVAPGAAAVAAAAHIDDTCSPGYVSPKSSVGSRPGEYLGTSQDDGHTDNA